MASKRKGAANSGTTGGKRRPPTGKPWPKGVSGNPAGAPRRGESWAELIKRVGEMTPSQAAEQSLELAKRLLSIGDGVTLKEAVVLRVYAALLFEPDARLLGQIMDRAEGKVAQTVNIVEVRAKLIDGLRSGRLSPADVESELGHDLATELFVAAGVSVAQGAETGAAGQAAADAEPSSLDPAARPADSGV